MTLQDPEHDHRQDQGRDYQRIARIIDQIRAKADNQPSLSDLAQSVALSPGRLQRLFRRWAGLSPKRFLQHLTLEAAKERLRASESVLGTAFDVGLSGPSRLHDLLVTYEGLSPGEFKSAGEGLRIAWGLSQTPFGSAFMALAPRGICALSFLDDPEQVSDEQAALRQRWPEANLIEDQAAIAELASQAFSNRPADQVRLLVRGSAFELKVWKALLRIPPGAIASYAHIARAIGRPKAARALGGAIGRNPIAVLIPCHRVLRAGGEIGGYRWGSVRKRALLVQEAGRRREPCGGLGGRALHRAPEIS